MTTDEKIFDKLKELALKFIDMQKEIVAKLKLNLNVYKIVCALSIKKRLSQTSLSKCSGIDRPATCRLISRLEEQNFVEKVYEAGDKKTTYVCLTGKGEALSEEIKQKTKEIRAKYFSELSEEEKQFLLKMLQKNMKESETNA